MLAADRKSTRKNGAGEQDTCDPNRTSALFSRLRNDWTSITLRSIGSSAHPN
jgi:hypothetical protein